MKTIEDKRTGEVAGLPNTKVTWTATEHFPAEAPSEIEVAAKKPFLLSEAWDCDTPAQWLVSMVIGYGGAALGVVLVLSAGYMPELLRQALMILAALMMFSLTFCWVFRRPVGLYWIAALIERAFAGRSLTARPSEQ